MADEDIKARIRDHERSFEGMMSLIPADMYYGKDNSDQWKRKKQTKEEKKAAKRAKLEPGANKSALDVHKENQLKRRREGEDVGDSAVDNGAVERPGEGLQKSKNSKRQKIDHGDQPAKSTQHSTNDDEQKRREKAERRKAKRQEKTARKAKKREKRLAKKGVVAEQSSEGVKNRSKQAKSGPLGASMEDDDDESGDEEADDMAPLDMNGLEQTQDALESSPSPASTAHSGTFDEGSHSSAASSSSSIIPAADTKPDTKPTGNSSGPLDVDTSTSAEQANPAEEEGTDEESESEEEAENGDGEWSDVEAQSGVGDGPEARIPQPQDRSSSKETRSQPASTRSKALNLPNVDTATLQARLATKLAAFRKARHADGLDGRPARSRAELIDARRRKEDQRKAHKKEIRAKARLAKDAEEEAARLRGGSGSPLWSPGNLPGATKEEEVNRFSFGRVAFDDGTEADPSLTGIKDARRMKGPQDAKGALAVAQKKAARISGYEAAKRKDIGDKDTWLNAAKRVHGEKIRDDQGLLKKSIKRQDKLKAKSGKEWQGRLDTVKHGKEAKQKRREDNLAKRRDEKKRGKGGKGGSGGNVRFGIQFGGGAKKDAAAAAGGKVKKRPGFEGTFKGSKGSRV